MSSNIYSLIPLVDDSGLELISWDIVMNFGEKGKEIFFGGKSFRLS
jgi:hypothetical protein